MTHHQFCRGGPVSDAAHREVYAQLAGVGPYGVNPGHALITMVEPHVGHERAYNRWYEDDHFVAGAMAMPWIYAGRRWVATRDLQLLRYPRDSAIARPVTRGCYLSVYWVTDGRYSDHLKWSVRINQRLNSDGRVFHDRTHVFTAFHKRVATVYRDGRTGPRDFHALDYPYKGLVVAVIDFADSVQRASHLEWLSAEFLTGRLSGSPAAMVMAFYPHPLPEDRMPYVKQVEGVENRLTLLCFLEEDPRVAWNDHFVGRDSLIKHRGLGSIELVAPFIPTLPGTDCYVDKLR
ncbi:hypothetical protein [Streptomyces sp. NPDC059649]|uniref:hypothetical protein n=1 Tax=Streptomyces sp. NPDC059649 TaxID=3346895 RepID=UPI0036A31924